MPAQAGTQTLREASKTLLFVNKKKQKNFENFPSKPALRSLESASWIAQLTKRPVTQAGPSPGLPQLLTARLRQTASSAIATRPPNGVVIVSI